VGRSGLALDPATGTISGTPEAACRAVSLTVRAKNKFGSTATSVSIRVLDVLTMDACRQPVEDLTLAPLEGAAPTRPPGGSRGLRLLRTPS
jgi:hypothetical protein